MPSADYICWSCNAQFNEAQAKQQLLSADVPSDCLGGTTFKELWVPACPHCGSAHTVEVLAIPEIVIKGDDDVVETSL